MGVGGSNFCLPTAPMLDESVIIQLVEMGFPMDACRKAVYYTGNSGVEAAMNWVMSHMDDPGMRPWPWQRLLLLGCCAHVLLPQWKTEVVWTWAVSSWPDLITLSCVVFPAADFANPLVLPGSSGPGSTIACPDPPSEDSVATIVSMGFSRDQAMKALRATVRGMGDIRVQGFSQEQEF